MQKESMHKQLQRVMKWKEMGLITDEQFNSTKKEISELISMKKGMRGKMDELHEGVTKRVDSMDPDEQDNYRKAVGSDKKKKKKKGGDEYSSDSSGSWETDSESGSD